ncbi:COX15-CtaA-domain-containing protein [Basidiobolus meristosporus CBS 931.73]|uniref:COX15-CtaA-domain-containing protein n=1 Tax=Basidiobolus meristosporus CBS 931.73 TaxID=1314790 RepID=A0A1Y1WY98_9FUNG|nr:COX15-CtaA-domain-containing protein [Basidiobolus meristosporus CBS 931.73]|eukprot:ORX78176.1 COX15-CtaA-domain-containing protein [Basidiobolus meristosporus CBS 931.73]
MNSLRCLSAARLLNRVSGTLNPISRNIKVGLSSKPWGPGLLNRSFTTQQRNVFRQTFATSARYFQTPKSVAFPKKFFVKSMNTMAAAAPSATQAVQNVYTHPIVGYWLIGIGVMVFAIVVIGGVTRLTESGLSIVEWNLVTGIRPPITQAEWEAEFEKYKQFPEYKMLNKERGMTLEEFKFIFFFEWAHRLWGRVIGAAFILPAAYFAYKGHMSRAVSKRVLALGGLLGFQGALGWYMVKSGLAQEIVENKGVPRVSQYRLTAHLASAFFLYLGCLLTGWDILRNAKLAKGGSEHLLAAINNPKLNFFRRSALGLCGLILLTSFSGGFVAGLDAGMLYNEFPLMGGRLVPESEEIWSENFARPGDSSRWRNMFDNPVTVQFEHRVLATSSLAAVTALYFYSKRLPLPKHVRTAMHAVMGMAVIQVTLGISTLLCVVPVSLGAAHQSGSLALLTTSLYLLHTLKRLPK